MARPAQEYTSALRSSVMIRPPDGKHARPLRTGSMCPGWRQMDTSSRPPNWKRCTAENSAPRSGSGESAGPDFAVRLLYRKVFNQPIRRGSAGRSDVVCLNSTGFEWPWQMDRATHPETRTDRSNIGQPTLLAFRLVGLSVHRQSIERATYRSAYLNQPSGFDSSLVPCSLSRPRRFTGSCSWYRCQYPRCPHRLQVSRT